MSKSEINDIALKVIKEVVKEKKYQNLTEGVIANTNENMTDEQVRRVLEEVNKKVFTMIYSSEDDKEFGFEIAIMEDVLKAKKYKKAEGELKILGKKKKVSGVSNISSVEDMISLLKAASFILGNESDGDGFGKVSYDLAAEMIFEEIVVDAEIKTASAILDFMKKNKTMLNKQDAGIKKYVTEKKRFLVDKFIEKLAFDAGSAFNATVRVLPNYLKTKNEMKETLNVMNENGISRVNFIKNHMIGNGFGELMKMQV